MSEWKTVKVGDVFSATKGYGLSKDKILVGGAYECILYGDLYTQYSEVIKEVVNSTNHKDGVLSQLDDILIPCSTTTTAIDLATASVIKKKDVQLGGDITILRSKKGNLTDGEFFAYYLTNKKKNELAEYGQGITIVHLYYKHFKDMEIDLPPLAEQRRIAQVLGDIDDEIATLEELVAKKRLVKTAVMQQLLTGKVRLTADGRAVTGADIERELGHLRNWRRVKLGEIVNTLTTGKLDANAMTDNGKYRFYTCAKEYYFIDSYAFDSEALLVSGNGANVGYIHYYKGKFNAYQRTYVLSGFDDNIHFVKYIMDDNLSKRIDDEKREGNTPYIVRGTLYDMELELPDKPEQTRIADMLTDIDDDITTHEKLISKKRQVKTGVMQQLLTGKTRLLEAA